MSGEQGAETLRPVPDGSRAGRIIGPIEGEEGLALPAAWALLRARWRFLTLATLIATASTFVTAHFFMTPYYRATAVLRPAVKGGTLNQIGLANTLGALGGAFGALSSSGGRAEEYLAILKSYEFTTSLLDSHHLAARLDPPADSWFFSRPKSDSRWQLYQTMRKRFDCEYNRLSGNLTLHFLDPDPAAAKTILRYYVEDLREKLRHEQIADASAAVKSLMEEASRTPDTLLQTQLYELIAHQVQREKLAQVQADFAFEVIEHPMVPDRPHQPRVLLDCLLAAALALMLSAFLIVAMQAA